MNEIRRVTIVMLDSLGVGEQPDAVDFGQRGCNTIRTVSSSGLCIPNFEGLGLGNLTETPNVRRTTHATAAFGKMQEISAGNDTFAGVWEMVGLPFSQRFATYDAGLPAALISSVEAAVGRKVLGNRYASGPEMLRQYADEHIATGYPILYTANDGVVQITAHEDVISPSHLYRMGEKMTQVLQGHGIARIITRPFIGQAGRFTRTDRRVDFPVPSEVSGESLLDLAAERGLPFIATNHIRDLLSNKPVTESVHISDNADAVEKLLLRLHQNFAGIMFFGLLDLDEYGHKKDPVGYARELEAFDRQIPAICAALHGYDVLVFTADHGTDLISRDHDHTREYVPLLVVGPNVVPNVNLGIRESYADLGQTAADILGLGHLAHGESFAQEIERK